MVSIQLISLASREKIERVWVTDKKAYCQVSIQLISLASREDMDTTDTEIETQIPSFHSINFSSE